MRRGIAVPDATTRKSGMSIENGKAQWRASLPRPSSYLTHGIGMVSHEQPEISPTNSRPLEAGMVLSIETEFIHPEIGHVKIEDAVAVTETGCEGLGDLGREWHVVPV
jgi:Xaa-Pro aminopeptidase